MYNYGTPDSELQNFSSLLVSHHFNIAKAGKTVLPNSTQARTSRGKIAEMILTDQFSIAALPFSPIYEHVPKISKPCKNKLKSQ